MKYARFLAVISFLSGVYAHGAEDPLVTQSNITYQGAFRMSPGGSLPNNGDRLGYGGEGMGYNPNNNSLFIGGHVHNPGLLCEISIPTPSLASSYNSLPQAQLLQTCKDVTEGTMGSINPGDTNSKQMGGSLVYNNRLITTVWSFYDGNCSQRKSHGVSSSLNLSQTGNFSGFFEMNGSARPRAQAGYMTTIPAAWQTRLGGPALTGLGGAAIISCASSGVSATVFDPDDVGVDNPIPGQTLVDYPNESSAIVEEHFHWLNSANSRGIAFPEGSRSVLFIGSRGETRCYGAGTSNPALHGQHVPGEPSDVQYCYDPCQSSKGVHSYPYHSKIWAYDALDLEAVKNGAKSPDSIEPYATWDLPEMGSCSTIRGAAFDPASGSIFIAPTYAEDPKIYVYKVSMGPPVPRSPSISTQPNNRTVSVGQTATFSVTASGHPSPSYQWQKGSNASFVDINGATTASYTTPATTLADSGASYRCRVSNSEGTITSNAAVLTVNSPTPPAPATPSCVSAAGLTVINVSNVSQLRSAISSLASNQEIRMAAGTYNLTDTLYLPQNISNVVIRGSTGNRADVVLVGRGMNNTSGTTRFGFWADNVTNVLFADFTLKNIAEHAFMLNPGVETPVFCNLHIVDCGDQFIKANPDTTADVGVDNGLVQGCLIEYTSTAPNSYTNGVDVHRGLNWVIRGNTFRNIRSPNGQGLAGPAILVWNKSQNTIVERNLIINCEMGIALGLVDQSGFSDHSGGIIRNNIVHRLSAESGDVGILVADSPNTKVLNNTVILNGSYANAIEYRFATTSGVEIRNNLTDAAIQQRDNASATTVNNITNAQQNWFENAAGRDLHLVSGISNVIDKASSHVDITNDIDGQARPQGSTPDIGADEYSAAPSSEDPPENDPPPPPDDEATDPPEKKQDQLVVNRSKNIAAVIYGSEADVFDRQGHFLATLNGTNGVIRFDGSIEGRVLAAGVYVLKVKNSEGELLRRKVVVVK